MAHVTSGIPALPFRMPLDIIDLCSDDQSSASHFPTKAYSKHTQDALVVLEQGEKSEQDDNWETESFFEDAFENLEDEDELEDSILNSVQTIAR